MKQLLITRIGVWCLLAVLSPVYTLAANAEGEFSGSWSGSFDIHFADGRVINDTAWLVLRQSGTTVTGTVGPKAEQQGPIREGSVSGNELRFVADSTRGKILQFVLKLEGDRLSGEANGAIGDDPVRVVLNVVRRATAAAPAPDPLYQKILALDTALFDSFNKCADPAEFKKHAAFFAKDVEFFHDLGGVTLGVDALMANTKKNVCGQFRRELDLGSFRVFPIPGYGAMALGTHRFCHTPVTCEGVGEFTSVWREKDGVWQITRALSYAHRSL
ncbi:MAG TPA: nuclear transport factor 2 family protein [Steroidobacteraceae bacterium]|jgi:hypothetical protein|nr:nuclear transport factor 2 family protein [Steroidobacteraceae bacterium]